MPPAGAPPAPLVIIACGALVRELRALTAQLGDRLGEHSMTVLPAPLHNRPERIPAAVDDAIAEQLAAADDAGGPAPRFLLGYADCGTGGLLDAVIDRRRADGVSVERIPGAHCYEFFAGSDVFAAEMEAELGTFFLTDFLAQHFDTLIWQAYRLDRHPELRNALFGAYRRVVHLTQTDDPDQRARLHDLAADAAGRLGLTFEHRHTGLSPLRDVLVPIVASTLEDPADPCPTPLPESCPEDPN